jgi:cAMP-specific phosphodiesterase 4
VSILVFVSDSRIQDLISTLGLDGAAVRDWLAMVESLYATDVPFHNSTHAADVLHAVHFLLGPCGAAALLSPLSVLALLLAAAAHDAGHDGFNNLYHEHAQTDRALAHNDHSVQENYHCSLVFRQMHTNPRADVLAALPPAQAQEVRRLMITLILATDMKDHFVRMQARPFALLDDLA